MRCRENVVGVMVDCGLNYLVRHSHQLIAAVKNAFDCSGAIVRSFLGLAWGKVRST